MLRMYHKVKTRTDRYTYIYEYIIYREAYLLMRKNAARQPQFRAFYNV